MKVILLCIVIAFGELAFGSLPKIKSVDEIGTFSRMMGYDSSTACDKYSQRAEATIKKVAGAHGLPQDHFSLSYRFTRHREGCGHGNMCRWGTCTLKLASKDKDYGFFFLETKSHNGFGTDEKCEKDQKGLKELEGALDTEIDYGIFFGCKVTGLFMMKRDQLPKP
jgi:hypothetical protein